MAVQQPQAVAVTGTVTVTVAVAVTPDATTSRSFVVIATH